MFLSHLLQRNQSPLYKLKKSSKTRPHFYRSVDMSDLPHSMQRNLKLPDRRDTMSRSSTAISGLDNEKGKQELSPRGPSTMLPRVLTLKIPLKNLNTTFRSQIYLKVNT